MSDMVEAKPSERLPVARTDFGSVLQGAIDKGIDPASLGAILAAAKEYRAMEAKAAFDSAMAEFKASCPPIPRRTENAQFSVVRNGVKVNRKYAALEDIEGTIRGPLGVCGLSYRWAGAKVESNQLTMTCIVSHAQGHSVESPVVIPVESRAGCSEQQKYGSAMTYAQRYSLIQALGLTTCDEDADGNAPDLASGPKVTPEQADELQMTVAEVGADKAKFLAWVGVASYADVPASEYPRVLAALKAKGRK